MPEDTTVDVGTEFEDQTGTDTGADEGSDNEGTPGQPNSVQPEEDWKSKHDAMLEQNRALNRLLVEARRQANSNKSLFKPGQANDQGGEAQPQTSDFNTAMRLAESDLRAELDGILDLYPELPANQVKLIRSNPWAYASRNSFLNLNVPNALLDVETWVADFVAGLASEEPGTQEPQAPTKAPASKMRPNAAPEGGEEEVDVVPGSPEDTDLYTMPLDKLERKVNRKIRK